MLEKKSYKNPLKKGQRCVVLAEGFYEWKAVKSGKKQPYFIHLPKDEKEKSEAPLLAMAGIFEKAWVDDEDLESEDEIDLPDLVSAEDDDIYDDDDIELVDLD